MHSRVAWVLAVSVLFLFFSNPVLAQSQSFGNDEIEISFVKVSGDVFLSSVKNLETDYSFTFKDKSLWELVLINLDTLEEKTVNSDNTNCGSTDIGVQPTFLVLKWDNCVIDSTNSFDVKVYVYLNGPSVNMRLRVTPRFDKYSLIRIGNAVTVSKDTGLNSFVALPTVAGLLVKEPETNLVGYSAWSPGQGSVQISPYWVSNGNGLWIATNDATAMELKQHIYTGDGTGFTSKRLYVVPNSLDVAIDTYVPFDFVLGVFEGDWYDAAKIYRSWAEGTPLLSKGKLQNRSDIPLWWKEVELSEIFSVAPSNPQSFSDMMNRVKEYYDVEDMAVFVWNPSNPNLGYGSQGDYPSYDKMIETSEALDDYGIKTMHRVWAYGFDKDNPNYSSLNAEQYASKLISGEIYEDPNSAMMDHSTSFWRNRLIDVIVKQHLLTESKANGMFWDNPYPLGYSQYFPSSNRTEGPGGNWQYSDYVSLMNEVRSEGRSIVPDFVTAHEAAFEGYIQSSDTSAPHGFLKKQIAGAEVIPMFETIFSGYIPFMISNHEYFFLNGYPNGTYTDLKYMTLSAVSAFRWGHSVNTQEAFSYSMGENVANHEAELFSQANSFPYEVEKMKEYASFLKKLIDLRKNNKKFLVYGELLRPVSTNSPNVNIPFRDATTQQVYNLLFPKVVNSAWKASDGTVGVFLGNYNREAQSVSYTINYSQLGLNSSKSYNIFVMNEAGEKSFFKTISNNSTETTSISPLSTQMIELSEYSGAFCGDYVCNGNENSSNCSQDCGPAPSCGDDVCNGNENPLTCSLDCDDVCGDNYCSGDETVLNCSSDCDAVCGDGYCTGIENQTNCLEDCGTLYVCGNSIIEGNETCDDGNNVSGNGCSSNCLIENGWICIGAPSVCAEKCGDGLIVGEEVCDSLGNIGCNANENCVNACRLCQSSSSTGEYCGDDVCSISENHSNCPNDCPILVGDNNQDTNGSVSPPPLVDLSNVTPILLSLVVGLVVVLIGFGILEYISRSPNQTIKE